MKYAIHEDFQKLPVANFKYNKFVIGLVNGYFKLECFLTARKLKAKAKVHHVSGVDGNRIEVLQFVPDNAPANKPLPAVINYHGGGYALTYASSHLKSADHYANHGQCAIFFVDYRLAASNPFLDGFNDCYSVLEWLGKNAASLGIDPDRIAVMGDSAGGGYAAGVAQRAQDEGGPKLPGQILIYPTIDSETRTESAKTFTDTPIWHTENNIGMWKYYLRNSPGRVPKYAAPSDRKSLAGLPMAYVENAEFDPLRDEGTEYAERLKADGVDVTFNQTRGTVHGFDALFDAPLAQEAHKNRCSFIKKIFSAKPSESTVTTDNASVAAS